MISTIRILAFVLATALAASAEPYWIAYEGNDFPENEGWTRFSRGGGALRSLDMGTLVLDARQGQDVTDWYAWRGAIDPEPPGVFMLQWRVLLEQADPRFGVSLGVFSDESWAVGFEFDQGHLQSAFEPDVRLSFVAGMFHDFELRSNDMRTYTLSIDGVFVRDGYFVQVFTSSEVSWGDGIVGGQSLSTWDFVSFGVVPEPKSVYLLVLGVLCHFRRFPRNSRNQTREIAI